MARKRTEWEIVDEINRYASLLTFEEEHGVTVCPQTTVIMALKREAAKLMNTKGYTKCLIINAEEICGGISVTARFVSGFFIKEGVKYAILTPEKFSVPVSRENGLVIAKVFRRLKAKTITIGA